jgi:hypothetical protein
VFKIGPAHAGHLGVGGLLPEGNAHPGRVFYPLRWIVRGPSAAFRTSRRWGGGRWSTSPPSSAGAAGLALAAPSTNTVVTLLRSPGFYILYCVRRLFSSFICGRRFFMPSRFNKDLILVKSK